MKKLMALGLVWVGLSRMGLAQVEPVPGARPVPPSGALINPAPLFSAWTIAFTYPQDRVGPGNKASYGPLLPNAVRKVVATKTRNVIHEMTTYVSGGTLEKWQVNATFYIKPTGQTYWGAYDPYFQKNNPTPDITYLPLPESGFRDLGWIGNDSYAGTVKQYLLFVPVTVTNLDFTNVDEVQKQPVIAYVDAVTRLPVVIKNGSVIETFTFNDAPDTMQILPPDLSKEIADGNEKRRKLLLAPPKEY